MQFHCPQHQCADCQQKTGDAGGMIYRCRWCERGYCEDCLDWDKTKLLGENLLEYELLGFPAVVQAFYIECPSCHDHHEEDTEAREFCANMAQEFECRHREMLEKQILEMDEMKTAAMLPPSRAESLTDATTLNDSGISTPKFAGFEDATSSKKRKREAVQKASQQPPMKRSSRLSG